VQQTNESIDGRIRTTRQRLRGRQTDRQTHSRRGGQTYTYPRRGVMVLRGRRTVLLLSVLLLLKLEIRRRLFVVSWSTSSCSNPGARFTGLHRAREYSQAHTHTMHEYSRDLTGLAYKQHENIHKPTHSIHEYTWDLAWPAYKQHVNIHKPTHSTYMRPHFTVYKQHVNIRKTSLHQPTHSTYEYSWDPLTLTAHMNIHGTTLHPPTHCLRLLHSDGQSTNQISLKSRIIW